MTPTLFGRWQTRTALLVTIGLVVTAIFQIARPSGPFFVVLFFVWLFGLGWDVVYIGLQKLRWDRVAHRVSGWDGGYRGVVHLAADLGLGLPGIRSGSVSGKLFLAQYGLIWLTTFLFVQGRMRSVTPWWRFRGGRSSERYRTIVSNTAEPVWTKSPVLRPVPRSPAPG